MRTKNRKNCIVEISLISDNKSKYNKDFDAWSSFSKFNTNLNINESLDIIHKNDMTEITVSGLIIRMPKWFWENREEKELEESLGEFKKRLKKEME